MKKRLNNKKGFTLVELIVVIAILGILAAIAVPRFVNTLGSAREATDLANQKVVQAAVNLYVVDNDGNYPAATTFPQVVSTLAAGNYLDQNSIAVQDTGASFTYSSGFVGYTPAP